MTLNGEPPISGRGSDHPSLTLATFPPSLKRAVCVDQKGEGVKYGPRPVSSVALNMKQGKEEEEG